MFDHNELRLNIDSNPRRSQYHEKQCHDWAFLRPKPLKQMLQNSILCRSRESCQTGLFFTCSLKMHRKNPNNNSCLRNFGWSFCFCFTLFLSTAVSFLHASHASLAYLHISGVECFQLCRCNNCRDFNFRFGGILLRFGILRVRIAGPAICRTD